MKLYFYNMYFYTHDGDSCVLREQSRQLQKHIHTGGAFLASLSWQGRSKGICLLWCFFEAEVRRDTGMGLSDHPTTGMRLRIAGLFSRNFQNWYKYPEQHLCLIDRDHEKIFV